MEIQLSPIEITQLVNQIILISGWVGALGGPLEDLCTNYNHNCHFVIGLSRGTRPTLLELEMASPGCPDRERTLMPTPDVILRLYPSTPAAPSPYFCFFFFLLSFFTHSSEMR